MKILFSPIVSDKNVEYKFSEDIIEVTLQGEKDVFDFSEFGDGKLQLYDAETGEELLETTLPQNPVFSAERRDGVLYVVLENYINVDATHEECFPEWIDHTEYKIPVVEEEGEANGTDEVEEAVEEEIIEEEIIEEEDSITIEPPSEEDVEGWDDY